MELTIQIRRLEDGRYRSEAPELPAVYYEGQTEGEVRERMARLAHALRSPHIRIEKVLPDGDVVLTLRREEDDEIPDEGGTRRAPPRLESHNPTTHLMLVG